MKTKDAVKHILDTKQVKSKYALAMSLGVTPIMIDHYLKGTRMRQEIADRVEEFFKIKIEDVYDTTRISRKRK